jgi:ATP-dependent HslUV protease ATP-binding subunit HslU
MMHHHAVKVEATKFTEVGYHGRDVDQIIRDLMDVSMQLTRRVWTEKLRAQAALIVEERILDLLTGPAVVTVVVASANNTTGTSSSSKSSSSSRSAKGAGATAAAAANTGSHDRERGRESFREMLRNGDLDDQEIEVDVPLSSTSSSAGDMSGSSSDASGNNPNLAALWQQMSSAAAGGAGAGGGSGKKQPMERKKLPIAEARSVILQVELDKLLETVDLKKEAITAAEESGIVFIDEMYGYIHTRKASNAPDFGVCDFFWLTLFVFQPLLSLAQ